MTLPVMARHKVPVTPPNYAVWYSYVSGTDSRLTAEIDRLIESKTAFTGEINDRLFRDFASECDLEQFNKVRGEMATILNEVSGTLSTVGSEAQSYGGTLDGVVRDIETSRDLDDIREVLISLVTETRSMQRSTHLLQEHLESKSHEITLLQEELEAERKRASRDPLTGLANRMALFDALEKMTDNSGESRPLSVLMLDIDHFKRVNDTFGHLIGDRVIRFVAQVLQQNTKGRDLAARYGGEEFAVLLPDTGLEGAKAVAERIRVTVADAKLVRSDNKEPLGQITTSVGVAQYHRGEDAAEFINRADQALYASKHNGRNKVTLSGQVKNGAQSA